MSNLSRLLKASANLKNKTMYFKKKRENALTDIWVYEDNIKRLDGRLKSIKKQLDEGFTKQDIEEYLKGNQVDVTV